MYVYTVEIVTKDDIITTQISATSMEQAFKLSVRKFKRMYGDASEIQEVAIYDKED